MGQANDSVLESFFEGLTFGHTKRFDFDDSIINLIREQGFQNFQDW